MMDNNRRVFQVEQNQDRPRYITAWAVVEDGPDEGRIEKWVFREHEGWEWRNGWPALKPGRGVEDEQTT